jgi:glycosyltransferase involved in cell wall biosynthesis
MGLSDKVESCPVISLIVAVDNVGPGARRSIDEMHRVMAGSPVEIIVASRERWADASEGETVVVFDSPSRGDRYDRAAVHARGSLLAFTDDRIRFSRDWSVQVLALFANAEVAIGGGPVLPRSRWKGERISAILVKAHLAATPGGHLGRIERSAAVSELAGSNLVVRKDVFWAVGGFQSPNVGQESVRLCYKVRSLLGREVRYSPSLAVAATARRFPGSFLAEVAGFGRARGDMARRCPELAPFFPYALPALAVLSIAAELGLLPLRLWKAALIGSVVFLGAYLIQAVAVLRASGRLNDRVLAALALPLVPLTYGSSFIRGFLGPNQGEVSPPRSRQRSLRILIINWRDITHPHAGGAEMYMHEIGRRWAEQGIDVGWLCQRSAQSLREESLDGIRITRIGGRFTLYPRVVFSYLRRLRGRYDLIVDCENGIPFFTPLFTRTPRILVVHHVHTEIFRRQTRPPLRWLGLFLESRLMPMVYRRTQVVAVSESTRNDLIALGFVPDRVSIVHNGVYTGAQVQMQRAPQPTILYIGRLTPQKCVDVIIKAMPRVLAAVPEVRLDIVGQGPDRTRLERLAWSLRLADHVRFHGYQPGFVRDQLAAQAWVAVCPSAYEGWGVSCVEASARGLPVVASNVNGLRDSVRDGETGVLVPRGDYGAFARVLIELLGDPVRREAMGQAGRLWAALHSWDRSASELLTVFARRPPGPVASAGMANASERSAPIEAPSLASE